MWMHFLFHLILNIHSPFPVLGIHILKTIKWNASSQKCWRYLHPKTSIRLTCVIFWLGWFTSAVWSSLLTSSVSSCLPLTSWSVDTTWIHNELLFSAWINRLRFESNYWNFLNERMRIRIEKHSVEYFFSILPGFQQWLQSERLEIPYPSPEAKAYEIEFCKGNSLAWSRSPAG